jgi:hypothetical protein
LASRVELLAYRANERPRATQRNNNAVTARHLRACAVTPTAGTVSARELRNDHHRSRQRVTAGFRIGQRSIRLIVMP